jgi:hypothetical protein
LDAHRDIFLPEDFRAFRRMLRAHADAKDATGGVSEV